MLKRFAEGLRQFVSWWTVGRVGLALAILGVVATVAGHLAQYGRFDLQQVYQDLYANLGTELLSIAITVLIIDQLAQRRDEQQRREREREREQIKLEHEKERLIRQLGSSMNVHAKRAAEELRAQGWLEDGSLVKAPLTGANLEGANLRHANLAAARLFRANLKGAGMFRANLERAQLRGAKLQGARLGSANLRHANLAGANLEDTYLSGAKLEGANLLKANLKGARGIKAERFAGCRCLYGATMPGGERYDGRHKLSGDLELARRDGIDAEDTAALDKWYKSDSVGKDISK